ncbi:ATPase, P-type (transporting), HAD superfamily, subfamily IC [Caldanaerovirga acetigignens]|uniref:ATPase, P-type (Transporting), HAD superfamily, subfamily IC n=1 Tax=Caldanaerovirga acetigignens TaxID=447595 RepID=A0A1M7HHP4_9FIRM|nr:HAD-IC family P-type ATPase [Caldanaerovirga acetigignens]SHM28051.1 ATPase, P-type (transporting), HAD superfamily, subfamily IC [Caldanaerovirga acetigignens]
MKKRKNSRGEGFENIVKVMMGEEITLKNEEELNKGELVIFQTGDIIPADIVLLEANNLEMDEFDLTGEIKPVRKKATEKETVTTLERSNMVFRGTKVLRGSGKGIVLAAGEDTEYGKILIQASKTVIKTSGLLRYNFPLQLKQDIYLQILIIPALLWMLLYRANLEFILYLYLATNLWLIVFEHQVIFNYIILNISNRFLFKKGIFIRDFSVFDSLIDIDVVCFDKTGVITSRDMDVSGIIIGSQKIDIKSYTRKNEILTCVFNGFVLCNDLVFTEELFKLNPIDKALIHFAKEHGFSVEEIRKGYERVYELPFSSENRYMVAGYVDKINKNILFYAKGDPEVIFTKCNRYVTLFGEVKKIDGNFLLMIREVCNNALQKGSSVIAMALKTLDYFDNVDYDSESKEGYILLSLIILENLPRKEAGFVLRKLKEAGLRCLMLTGDITATAQRIAEEVGFKNTGKYLITGKDIEKMSISEVSLQSDDVELFTRLSPSQKGIVVEALKRKGHRVAMIGDGVNDVIALKLADISISFKEKSSVLAQKTSKVLINNDLRDVLQLIMTGKKIGNKIKITNYLRIIVQVLLLVLVYYISISVNVTKPLALNSLNVINFTMSAAFLIIIFFSII